MADRPAFKNEFFPRDPPPRVEPASTVVQQNSSTPGYSRIGRPCPGYSRMSGLARGIHAWTALPGVFTHGRPCPGYSRMDGLARGIHAWTALVDHGRFRCSVALRPQKPSPGLLFLRQKPSLDSFRSNLKTFLFPKL